ncbi:MAG: adenosylhomocysteinase [Clostridiales bacterium]|nr:adenosylhomocysteinase [Candidatus Apopatocola equi]
MNYIRDISLAPSGEDKIEWVRRNMAILRSIQEEFERDKPFAGLKIALSIHLEAKTAYLCRVLAAGGAEMYVTGSNPLSTQDDIAAALASSGMNVFAVHAATAEEYNACIESVVKAEPDIVIDDGGDILNMIHNRYPQLEKKVLGGCEETTTGIHRLRAMERDGELRFPMFDVNDADCKHLSDNRYGTGQSVFDGINGTTNLVVAGKRVVVAGYGWCGRGVAMRAKGLGAKVIVTEIDPVKAIEAVMDGFEVMPMAEAAPLGDIFVTVTGCSGVITEEHFLTMKDGVLLSNAGHFDVEVDVKRLGEIAVETRPMKPNIMGYKLANGNWLYVLGEGRLVNLAAGNGHPAEIMDMSFGIQALCARYVAEHRGELPVALLSVPVEIDKKVALLKLNALGVKIDTLTAEQEHYVNSWNV